MEFWILDVFARDAAGTGNPLAVVAYPPSAPPSAEEMQAIAFEFGFSETTFVSTEPDDQGIWPTRIFTPNSEMPFAGHPTLGTAWVVAEHLRFELSDHVRLGLKVGTVSVDRFDGNCWLTAPPVERRESPDRSALLREWNLDLSVLDATQPLAAIDTGPVFAIVPLRSVEALESLTPPPSGPGLLYVLARVPEAPDSVRVRMFAPSLGVPEDPATGSAAVCLGRYLLDTDYLGQGRSVRVRVFQGQEMGRPSLLQVLAERDADGHDRIRVGGQVRPFARGRLGDRS